MIMNKTNLDMNMFTMKFGKMTVPTDEHLDKVEEEYYELCGAYEDYEEAKYENMHPEDIEDYRKKLCLEALDMVQASISFVSHLIEECIMTDEDIEAWKIKLEDRKKKYLKQEKFLYI